MTISKRLRFEILTRDGHRCRYCGATAPDVPIRVDHVLAVALGGTDDPTNLVAACHDCNAGKSSMVIGGPVVADVTNDALRWASARARALELHIAGRVDLQATLRRFDQAWNEWHTGEQPVERDGDWRGTVELWLKRGLTLPLILHYIPVAMNSRVRADGTWRYYCGILWKVITEVDEQAARAIEIEELNAQFEAVDNVRALIF